MVDREGAVGINAPRGAVAPAGCVPQSDAVGRRGRQPTEVSVDHRQGPTHRPDPRRGPDPPVPTTSGQDVARPFRVTNDGEKLAFPL